MNKRSIKALDRIANKIAMALTKAGFDDLSREDKGRVNIAIASLEKAADGISNVEFMKEDAQKQRLLKSAQRYIAKAKTNIGAVTASTDRGIAKAKSDLSRIAIDSDLSRAEEDVRKVVRFLSTF